MANIYTYFDNGTFESYAAPFNTPPVAGAGSPIARWGRVTEEKYAGNASLALYTPTDLDTLATPGAITFRFDLLSNQYHPAPLVSGKTYTLRFRVKTSNIKPIGTDGVKIAIMQATKSNASIVDEGPGPGGVGRIIKVNGDTGFPQFKAFRTKVVTVAEIKANPWVELWCEFTDTVNYPTKLSISFVGGNDYPTALLQGITEKVNNDGRLWLDQGTLDAPTPCDLALGSPAYTKTDESGVGLNDGTATINATSSFTKSYSSDNITFQSSNVFTGLAVGIHTFYVKDTNPLGCNIQTQVQILQFTPAPPPPPPPGPSTLDIDAKPVNSNNFVSWFPGNGKITFTDSTVSNCCWDIPAAYRQRTKGKNNMRHALVAVNGEELSFYINFDNPINDPDFSSYRLSLVSETGLVSDNIAPLSQDLFSDGVTYNIFANVTLNGITNGRYYKFVIYNTATEDIIYVSGLIEVLSIDEARCLSTRLRYRATINLYGFRYEALPEYFNQHRLRFYRVDEQEEANLVQYRAVSSGQLRNINVELDRYIALEAYFFDDLAQRATGVFQVHDMIFLNGVSYLVKTPNKRTFDKDKELYKSTIEFYEMSFSTRNRYNRLGNMTILSDLLLQAVGSRVKL